MLRIALVGGSGKLGKEIASVCHEKNIQVVNIFRETIYSSNLLNTNIAEECVICDVTLPQGTRVLCDNILLLNSETLKRIKGLIIGVTGLTPEVLTTIEKVAQLIPVCIVENFSKGIYLLQELLTAKTSTGKPITQLISELGFDVSIHEIHHQQKIDAPSGTAKVLAKLLNIPLEKISSSRIGDVVGEHQLIFSGNTEDIRLTHVAHSRKMFAYGAVSMCEKMFAANLKPGLYEKRDLL